MLLPRRERDMQDDSHYPAHPKLAPDANAAVPHTSLTQ